VKLEFSLAGRAGVFIVAIATYLPATVFLLVVMVVQYRRSPTRDYAPRRY
jgi:hypothetical protein